MTVFLVQRYAMQGGEEAEVFERSGRFLRHLAYKTGL